MNLLQRVCRNWKWNENALLNFFKDYGFVSDNCVSLEDVANAEQAHRKLLSKWHEWSAENESVERDRQTDFNF